MGSCRSRHRLRKPRLRAGPLNDPLNRRCSPFAPPWRRYATAVKLRGGLSQRRRAARLYLSNGGRNVSSRLIGLGAPRFRAGFNGQVADPCEVAPVSTKFHATAFRRFQGPNFLGGDSDGSNLLKNLAEFRGWCDTKCSISVQEGQPFEISRQSQPVAGWA